MEFHHQAVAPVGPRKVFVVDEDDVADGGNAAGLRWLLSKLPAKLKEIAFSPEFPELVGQSPCQFEILQEAPLELVLGA